MIGNLNPDEPQKIGIEHRHSGVSCQVSDFRSKSAKVDLKPET